MRKELSDLLYEMLARPLLRGKLPDRERPVSISGVNIYPQQLGRVLAAKSINRVEAK